VELSRKRLKNLTNQKEIAWCACKLRRASSIVRRTERTSSSLISHRVDELWRAVIENPAQSEQTTKKTQEPNGSASIESKTDLPVLNPEYWVEKYWDVLFGFAASRVSDQGIAKDLVQETFLAALNGRDAFAGRSSERAWLFGILRNKLVDYYRLQSREVSLDHGEASLPEEQGAFCASGLGKDGWVARLAPRAWETPDKSLSDKEFHAVLRTCMSRLPERIAQVFKLREIDELSTEEICNDLGVLPNNLCVMLHRARMGLRRCLEVHWFENNIKNKQSRR